MQTERKGGRPRTLTDGVLRSIHVERGDLDALETYATSKGRKLSDEIRRAIVAYRKAVEAGRMKT